MKVLFFGAGPLGSLYAGLFHAAGIDVSLLARGARCEWLLENGLVLRNEMTGEESRSRVRIATALDPADEYDLAIVLVRKNRLCGVFERLAPCTGIRNILFMGNNARGFGEYRNALPPEKLLFGFPGAGGGLRNEVVHYADRETPRSRRRAVTLGEVDGQRSARLLSAKRLFEAAGVPVDTSSNIDGWLRYHVALVGPLAGALYKHHCDNYRLAKDRETIRVMVRAAREGGEVLASLGFRAGEPREFKLMRWLPVGMSARALQKMLGSRFAEVAFAMHARTARDELMELVSEFRALINQTSVHTPGIDLLEQYVLDSREPGGVPASG